MTAAGVSVLLCGRPFSCKCGYGRFLITSFLDWTLNTFRCVGCGLVYEQTGKVA